MSEQAFRVKTFLKIGLFVLCFICFPRSTYATEALPSSLVIGDNQGLYATSAGEYYIDLNEVKPGDHYRKEITIRSLDLKEPFDLGLLVSKKSATGSIDWSQHITVRLTLDGKKLYDGPLLGDGRWDWTKTPLELGTCEYGTDKLLVAEFEVDTQLTTMDMLESSELYFYWTFVAVKKPIDSSTESSTESSTQSTRSSTMPTSSDSSDKRLPKTGEQIQQRIILVIGVLLILIVLLLWKKNQNERK